VIIIVNLSKNGINLCSYAFLSLKELILADLELKLIDAALGAQYLLLKSGLLGLQVGYLLLQAG
jgi:hypothetical protein